MLDYIFRLITDFEKEHGFNPNLLYINYKHSEHLRLSFDENLTLQQIMNILKMEVIVELEIIHPRVSWSQTAAQMAC